MGKYVVSRLFLLGFSIFLSYQIAYGIAERFFFDRFFYYKSIDHGYWLPERQLSITDFGRRSRDVAPLFENVPDTELGALRSRDAYVVAVIGDSYVWGQGVRYERAFPYLLEKKLSRVADTVVLSLATSGDDIVEHYSKYKYVDALGIVDAYVFLPVNNDILLNLQRKYSRTDDAEIYARITRDCGKQTGTEPVGVRWSDWDTRGADYYETMMKASYDNPANRCVVRTVIDALPKDNAMYLVPVDNDTYLEAYVGMLTGRGLYAVRATSGKSLRKYSPLFADVKRNFRISVTEDHPSVAANALYADLLVRELVNNPKWRFGRRHR